MLQCLEAAPGGDHIANIRNSRLDTLPVASFGDGDSHLLARKCVWNFGDSRENVLEMHGDCSENLFEILAVAMISSPISSASGL